jgi:hypothetical protein
VSSKASAAHFGKSMSGQKRLERDRIDPIGDAAALAALIYAEMIVIMQEFPQLHIEDYDLPLLNEKLIQPVANYLSENYILKKGDKPSRNEKKIREKADVFVKPILVSGMPGIGKTTLLMVLDEALQRLTLLRERSCRSLVAGGDLHGYFLDKGILSVVPLSLFGIRTAVLSARDWNNILRHWTYDESVARDSDPALSDLIHRLRGKVIMVDEAEWEGYVYFTELFATNGIMVILSSNLDIEHIHLPPDHFSVLKLIGPDHRQGQLSSVVLPDGANEWFDLFAEWSSAQVSVVYGVNSLTIAINSKHLVYVRWNDIQDQPLLKDDFAHFFKQSQADMVLLDRVPFFSDISEIDVDPGFLGHLFRFVNFVDAIHDSQLPLLVRGTYTSGRNLQAVSQAFQAVLYDYDGRVGGKSGHVAWIEWNRCLSRLKSREALNIRFWK